MGYDENFSDHAFDQDDTPAAPLSYTIPCADLEVGDYVILRGRACEIMGISPYGADHQVQFIGKDLFTGMTVQELCLSSRAMDVPYVHYKKYTFSHSDDGDLVVLNDNGSEEMFKHPEGKLGKKIEDIEASSSDAVVTVLSALNEDAVVDIEGVRQ